MGLSSQLLKNTVGGIFGEGKITGKMAMVGAMGAADIGMNVASGDNLGTATMKSAATGALFASNPAIMGTYALGKGALDIGWGIEKWKYQKNKWWSAQYATNNTVGGGFVDTQRAQTMRQAAVQAIQGSKLNARSALGGEARIMNPYSTRRY